MKRRYPKLSRRVQKLASKYIAEEVRSHKYGQKQAEAVGINRAKTYAKKHPLRTYKPKSKRK